MKSTSDRIIAVFIIVVLALLLTTNMKAQPTVGIELDFQTPALNIESPAIVLGYTLPTKENCTLTPRVSAAVNYCKVGLNVSFNYAAFEPNVYFQDEKISLGLGVFGKLPFKNWIPMLGINVTTRGHIRPCVQILYNFAKQR